MSDLMLYGVLRMPYEMAMEGELSRQQFYDRVQEAARRLQAAEARLAEIDATMPSLVPVADRLPHKATMVLATDGDNYALAYQRYDLGETAWYDSSDKSDSDVPLDFTPTHWAEVPRLAGSPA